MAKKFDTNPLDPEFPQKVGAEAALNANPAAAFQQPQVQVQQGDTTTDLSAETRTLGDDPADATRRYGSGINYVPEYQNPAQVYGLAAQNTTKLDTSDLGISSNRRVDKIGLPENILIALPYLPFYIGIIAGIVQLLIVQKSESKVRFHAAQGMAMQIAFFVISIILGIAGNASRWIDATEGLATLGMIACSIYFAYKAYSGKPLHIEAVDDLTDWLEEKIHPRN